MDIKEVILGTGSYFTVRTGNTISIGNGDGKGWGYNGPRYNKLAPRLETYVPYSRKYQQLYKLKETVTDIKEYLEFKNKIENQYIESYYEERLRYLNIEELISTLYKQYGKNIIFVCSEHPSDFCHRRLLADYIELKQEFIFQRCVLI